MRHGDWEDLKGFRQTNGGDTLIRLESILEEARLEEISYKEKLKSDTN